MNNLLRSAMAVLLIAAAAIAQPPANQTSQTSPSALESYHRSQQIRSAQHAHEADVLLESARTHAQAGRFDLAYLDLAAASERAGRMGPANRAHVIPRIEQAEASIRNAEQIFDQSLRETQTTEIAQSAALRLEQQQSLERLQQRERLVRVQRLVQARQYAAALALLEQLQSNAPSPELARIQRQIATLQHYHRVADNQRARAAYTRSALADVEQALIPDAASTLVSFPPDHRATANRREQADLQRQTPAAADPAAQQVLRRMNRNVPRLNVVNMPLADVLENLSTASGISMVALWPAIEAAGVSRSSPVSLTLADLPASQMLELVLATAAGQGTLAWQARGGIVVITSSAQLDSRTRLAVYDIADIVALAPSFRDGPKLDAIPQDTDPWSTGDDEDPELTESERLDAVVDMLQSLLEAGR